MLPLIELRGAIPFGVGALDLPLLTATIASILGSIISVIILLNFLPPVTQFARAHWPWLDGILQHLFTKTRSSHSKKLKKLGNLALIIFVAVPIPGSGAWMGSLIAHIFGFPRTRALLLISVGIILAGLIVSGLTAGVVELIDATTTQTLQQVEEILHVE